MTVVSMSTVSLLDRNMDPPLYARTLGLVFEKQAPLTPASCHRDVVAVFATYNSVLLEQLQVGAYYC